MAVFLYSSEKTLIADGRETRNRKMSEKTKIANKWQRSPKSQEEILWIGN